MINVNSTNLLEFLSDYLISIGCDETESRQLMSARNFQDGLILNLPAVCLIGKNKPETSKSKQSHIHVTSKFRYFFYTQSDIDNATASTPWIKQPIKLCINNIASLNNHPVKSNISIVNSFMMKKIECRRTQEKQVQLSKIKEDDSNFIKLREGLFEKDVLIFLKYRNSDVLFVVGIPNKYINGSFTFDGTLSTRGEFYPALHSQNAIPVKVALSTVMNETSDDQLIENDEDIVDSIYQNQIEEATPTQTKYKPERYYDTDSNRTSKSYRPKTNPGIAKEAIQENHFKCSLDPNHELFEGKNGDPYLEAHHLIPLNQQKNFINKLDTKANIIPLCPNCHKKLHHAKSDVVYPLIERLLQERKDILAQSGLTIDIDRLKKCY
mgnify:CR=1 FL=1